MKKIFPLVAIVLSLSLSVLPVSAAKPQKSGGDGTSTSNTIGIDVSWPQCGSTLPTDQAFGIVGVNGGTAAKVNPCLSEQLGWASASVGGTSQMKVQLYVNTANPGEITDQVTTWPTDNTDSSGYLTKNPYGTCDGANSLPCSWQYGWNRSEDAANGMFSPAALAAGMNSDPAGYVWWLDVETGNTWQSGSSDALARNAATLEGMTSYYTYRQATVGLYSTASQWSQIVGSSVSQTSNLNGLASWLPGSRTIRGAQNNCSSAPLTTGGKVVLTQYISQNLDHDYVCF